MTPFIQLGLQLALFVLILLMIPCAYRAWLGPSGADRLQAIDAITTLMIGIIIISCFSSKNIYSFLQNLEH